jgi:hypothetical protein
MLPYPGMPYGAAPAWCFPFFEGGTFALLAFCLGYAIRRHSEAVPYIVGGLLFGVLLEYMGPRSPPAGAIAIGRAMGAMLVSFVLRALLLRPFGAAIHLAPYRARTRAVTLRGGDESDRCTVSG